MSQRINNALEIIGQALFEMSDDPKTKEELESQELVNKFLGLTREAYILVQWPESQEFMEEEWFENEAIFCGGSEEKTGSSAYFIPLKYVI